jgi:hypothetical protein
MGPKAACEDISRVAIASAANQLLHQFDCLLNPTYSPSVQ